MNQTLQEAKEIISHMMYGFDIRYFKWILVFGNQYKKQKPHSMKRSSILLQVLMFTKFHFDILLSFEFNIRLGNYLHLDKNGAIYVLQTVLIRYTLQ